MSQKEVRPKSWARLAAEEIVEGMGEALPFIPPTLLGDLEEIILKHERRKAEGL